MPLLRYAARISDFTGLAITRMDSLGTFFPCYEVRIWDGHEYLDMPCDWGSDIESSNAKNYLKTIERLVGVPIKYISYGPGRDEIQVVKKRYSF